MILECESLVKSQFKLRRHAFSYPFFFLFLFQKEFFITKENKVSILSTWLGWLGYQGFKNISF